MKRALPLSPLFVAVLVAAFVVAGPTVGCGGPSGTAPGHGSDGSVTGAGASQSDGAAMGDDAATGNPTLSMATDGGGPLAVHIQINGDHSTCGACAIVLAQAQGGTQPYTYTWSDPSWNGPGPFQVCPEMPKPLSVTVTDSSASTGEVKATAQTAMAQAVVDCVASDGSAAPGALNGCIAMGGSGVPDAGVVADAAPDSGGSTECTANEVEAGVAWADGGAVASVASPLDVTLLAGHTYSVSYDRLLPIVLGQPVTVEIYGSTEPDVCKVEQKLFTLNLDSSIFNWHQAYCFTPDRDYHYVVTNVYIQGVLVFINILSVSTLCDSCMM